MSPCVCIFLVCRYVYGCEGGCVCAHCVIKEMDREEVAAYFH